MSEEERKAIEYLKERFELFEEDDVLAKWDYEAINTMLGLIDKLQKENAELKEEIKDLIEENHKHIDYIANMKKKHEDKIRELAQEYKPNKSNTFIESQEKYIELVKKLELLEEN